MSYSGRARQYATDVVEGRIVAGRLTRLACERHLDDLGSQGSDEFPYEFDADAADKVCRFVELLPHIKGEWARRKETLTLEPWQCFVVCCVFGWLRKADGLRRFRRVYTEVARKNAKSTLTAALGNYMLAADGEYGAEVYSGATTEKQAWEVFGPARLMAKKTDQFRDAFGVEVNAKTLNIPDRNSKFEPIIGNPGDGASPSFAITDEYHEHSTSEQFDTMVTGMGSREQPLSWVITTAGDDTAGPCYDYRGEVVNVLEGTVANDELFGVIFTKDEDDEWTSWEAIQKANPNLGVSVREDFLRSQQRDAINNPRKQSAFKRKHLNVWVTAASPFFNSEKWKRLTDSSLSLDDFRGEPCWVGVDLASKLDITCQALVFRRDEEWYAFFRAWCPEERTRDAEYQHYFQWVEEGDLEATPGNVTNYDYIEGVVEEDAERHPIVQLGFDPWNATQLAVHWMDAGIECVEVPQTTRNLSAPMKQVQALIEDGRLHHDGNAVASWAIGNVTAQVDRNDNVFPRKERDENKIDPAVALIIAMGRAMESEPRESVYESRGPLVFG